MQDKLWLLPLVSGANSCSCRMAILQGPLAAERQSQEPLQKSARSISTSATTPSAARLVNTSTGMNAMAAMCSIRIWQPMRKRFAPQTSALPSRKSLMLIFTDTAHSVAGEHTLSRMRLSMRYTAFWLSAVLSKPVRRRESLMAKAQNSLPPEETRYPGVSITARDGAHYAITQRRDDGHTPTFTLWSVSEDGGYAKLKSSTDYDALGSLIF